MTTCINRERTVKKLEVCVSAELLEPLRTELAAGGIVTSAVMVWCGWLGAGERGPGGRKAQKAPKANHLESV